MPDGAGELAADALLWRRLPPAEQLPPGPGQPHIVPKGSAFRTKGTEDGVSVSLASAFIAKGLGPQDLLDLEPTADATWGVIEITVAEAIALDLTVELDQFDETHALIKPPPASGKSRKLSKAARWAQYPLAAGGPNLPERP